MQTPLLFLFSVLLVSAPGFKAQECNPDNAATQLQSADPDFLRVTGELACKAPDIDLAQVTARLSGTLSSLTIEQLRQLPALVEATITVDPATLTPFFSLTSQELNTLVPLLTQIPTDKLAQLLPLLANQPEGTTERLLNLLNQIPQSKLEQLAPLFNEITEGAVNILIHAAQNLPYHAWQKLINLVRALGPVTDVIVGNKQALGLLPTYGTATTAPAPADGTVYYTTAQPAGGWWGARTYWGGRRLKQECNPSQRGIQIGLQLVTNRELGRSVGEAVCKFGAAELAAPLKQTLEVLVRQDQQTLSRLPAFTDALASVQPDTLSVVFSIPPATLSALIPALQGADPNVVSRQLKLLGSQSSETINKIIFFTNNISIDKIQLLLPLLQRLNDQQLQLLVDFLNALSPGQIVLAIHLLDKFGFAVDAIGQKIGSSQTTTMQDGSRVMYIGPVQAVMAPQGYGYGMPYRGFFFG